MSFQKSNGVVTLTMSVEDYQHILIALGAAAGCASRDGIKGWLELADRINEGNPNWTRYTDRH